jgi:hypothetical protein
METCSEFFWDLGFHRAIEVEHESRKVMSECFADGNLKKSFTISNDANLNSGDGFHQYFQYAHLISQNDRFSVNNQGTGLLCSGAALELLPLCHFNV